MKTKRFRIIGKCGLIGACLLVGLGNADAKPDKDKGGKDKGGSPGHSEKGKGDKGDKGNKGKGPEGGKDFEKDRKEFEKDVKDARKESGKQDKEIAKWREKRFRDDDRSGVVRYFNEYRDRDLGLPPGLAKNYRRGKPLPPGWQKKVNNGYVIEEGWSQYFHPLEYDTFPFLERVPDTRLYWYGDRVVRVYEPRREVIDVIQIPTIRFD